MNIKFFYLVFFIFILFLNSVNAFCQNDYLVKEKIENNTTITTHIKCDFGCSNNLNICKPPDLISLFILIIISFILFILLFNSNLITRIVVLIFILVLLILLTVSDFPTPFLRLFLILTTLVVIGILIETLLRKVRM